MSARTLLRHDHIKPFSQGGLSVPENLRTLCAECNIGRGPHAYAGKRKGKACSDEGTDHFD